MQGKLFHLNGTEWEELFYSLEGSTLKVSKTSLASETLQKIEITNTTKISLKDREENPSFTIMNEEIGEYKLKGPAIDVYSWIFFLRFCLSPPTSATPEYRSINKLGTNVYGSFVLCEHQNVLYVITDISKKRLIARLPEDRSLAERNVILSFTMSPFLIVPSSAYQDDEAFHIWVEYPAGGELLTFLLQPPVISVSDLRFYTAEIICALESLHKKFVVFKSLCPSNVLLSKDGHAKIGGYGNHKMLEAERTESDYLAPEVIKGEKYDYKADWWSLGIIIYEILFDDTPFEAESEEETRENVLNEEIKFRRFRDTPVADLISKLLEKDPTKRIDLDEIKEHPFFENINWSYVESRIAKPDTFEGSSIDYASQLASDFRLDSEMLPTSSAYYGLEGFSLGNDFNSDNFNVK